MQTYNNLEQIAYEAAVDMHQNNINFYESRYAPFYSVNDDLSPKDVLKAINSGFKQAENDFGIVSGLILCGMRHDPENVKAVAELAIEFKELIIAKIPSNRLGSPDDVANVVAFLCSDLANYITGETIHVNGGMYLC